MGNNIKNLVGPTKTHEHGNQFPDECKKYLAQIFHLIQQVGFFSFPDWGEDHFCFYHPNYSHQCQGDSLEYPASFKHD